MSPAFVPCEPTLISRPCAQLAAPSPMAPVAAAAPAAVAAAPPRAAVAPPSVTVAGGDQISALLRPPHGYDGGRTARRGRGGPLDAFPCRCRGRTGGSRARGCGGRKRAWAPRQRSRLASVHAALSRRARALRDRAAGHLAGARASLAAADAASRDAYEVVDRVGRRTHPIAGSRCVRARGGGDIHHAHMFVCCE